MDKGPGNSSIILVDLFVLKIKLPERERDGVVLRSMIGAQILVCKTSPLVTVTITVTDDSDIPFYLTP